MNAENKTMQKRVDRIISSLADSYPAVAITVNKMRFRQTNKIPTAACDYKGNGIYNPEFFDGLTDLNIKAIFIHEAMHLYLSHFSRFCKAEDVDTYDEIVEKSDEYARQCRLWNIAADAYINETILKQLPPNSLPGECVTFNTITEMVGVSRKELENGSTEKVYAKLVEQSDEALENFKQMLQDLFDQEQDSNSQDGSSISVGVSSSIGGSSSDGSDDANQNSSDNSGSGSGESDKNDDDQKNGSTNDSDAEESGDDGKELMDRVVVIIDKEIQDIIDEVYGKSKNNGGAESKDNSYEDCLSSDDNQNLNNMRAGFGNAHQELEIADHVVSISNIEWKDILSEFVYNISGKAASGRTWQRPSRRYRNIYPISQGHLRHAKSKDFTFAVDVSGSMNMDKICRAFDVVMEYASENEMSCKYYFWSTTKSDIYDFTTKDDFKRNLQDNYGGGTSLDCALNNYDVDGIGEGLIIVTDLEFDRIASEELERFGGPLVFIDIEPRKDYYGAKDSYVDEIEKSGNKYARFF